MLKLWTMLTFQAFGPYLKVAVLLVFLVFVMRLPYFFKDIFNWDESTFILMGQSILDGHLLYTDLWDVKPPFVFLSFALIIAIFGKSIIAIRFGGFLIVSIISFLTYCIGTSLWNYSVGVIAGIFSVGFICFWSSGLSAGESLLTEHLALVPLMISLYLLITKKMSYKLIFWTGFF